MIQTRPYPTATPAGAKGRDTVAVMRGRPGRCATGGDRGRHRSPRSRASPQPCRSSGHGRAPRPQMRESTPCRPRARSPGMWSCRHGRRCRPWRPRHRRHRLRAASMTPPRRRVETSGQESATPGRRCPGCRRRGRTGCDRRLRARPARDRTDRDHLGPRCRGSIMRRPRRAGRPYPAGAGRDQTRCAAVRHDANDPAGADIDLDDALRPGRRLRSVDAAAERGPVHQDETQRRDGEPSRAGSAHLRTPSHLLVVARHYRPGH